MALAEQSAFAKPEMNPFAGFGASMGAAWEGLGTWGRRATMAAVGAVFALTCGAAVAGVFRLPTDMKDGVQPDAMTVQDELPSAAAARTYALENPPTYAAQARTDADPVLDTTPVIATDDASLTRTAYSAASDDDQDKADQPDQDRDRSTAAPMATNPAATGAND